MSEFKSLKGQLLIDGGELHGSFFERTVVLICEHNEEGAFGLVLNKGTGEQLGNIVRDDIPGAILELSVMLGGPVQPSALSVLHRSESLFEGNVIGSTSLYNSMDDLLAVGETYTEDVGLRVFAGYSGWSPGQLEGEMERDSWLTMPATEEIIFDMPVEEIWKRVLSSKGWKYRLEAEFPENPELN